MSEVNEKESSMKHKDKKEEKKEKKEEISKTNEVEELKKQLEMYKYKYYRAIADLDNQRKQYDKEYHQALKYASQNLAEKLIPSFEMFSTVIEASDHLPPEVQAYVQGFDMVYRQMVQALESEGVSEIKVNIKDKFDHTIHSAMDTQVVDDPSLVDTVTKVVRKGYKIHDRLIRPTTVIVGKLKEANKDENEENKEVKNESEDKAEA